METIFEYTSYTIGILFTIAISILNKYDDKTWAKKGWKIIKPVGKLMFAVLVALYIFGFIKAFLYTLFIYD